MRYFIIDKKLLLPLIAALIFAVAACGFATNAVFTALEGKLLPIYRVKTEERKIAVTFDAAWGNEDTAELIDILAKHNAKATFFIVGDWADRFPESVKQLHDAGHSIQNHSDGHPHYPKLSREEIVSDAQKCNEKLKALTGVEPKYVRAPYGDYNNAAIEACDSLGLTMIQWDVDSLDWKKKTAQEMAQRIMLNVTPGSILLFHNAVANTPEALDSVLKQLGEQGYSFVTVDELVLSENYIIDNNGIQKEKSASKTRSDSGYKAAFSFFSPSSEV